MATFLRPSGAGGATPSGRRDSIRAAQRDRSPHGFWDRFQVTSNIPFDDRAFGLVGLKTTISGLSISLAPNTRYFISVQTESGDWAYTALGYFDGRTASAAMRDNGRNGYQGGYGWTTTWRWDLFTYASAAYRVEAIPEPHAGSLLLLAAGAALPRRRSG